MPKKKKKKEVQNLNRKKGAWNGETGGGTGDHVKMGTGKNEVKGGSLTA